MPARWSCVAAALLLAATVCCVRGDDATARATFHVSPDGDDAADGTTDHPFATLERARDAARRSRDTNGVASTILLSAGIHRLTTTLELDARDADLVIRGPSDRSARLHAGRVIARGALSPVGAGSIRDRLPAAARPYVVALDLAAAGCAAFAPPPDSYHDGGGLPELLWNDAPLPLSRWPNEGQATMERVLDRGVREGPKAGWRGGVFVAREDAPGRWRPAGWRVDDGVWLEGYWRVPWMPATIRVAAIDPITRTITHAVPVPGGIGSKYAPRGQLGDGEEPWCAVNLLEEIDRPGEWCLHIPSGGLYLWPPTPLGEAATGSIHLVDRSFPLVRVRGATGVRIESLTIEGGLGNGVEIEGGSGTVVAGCLLRNLGGTAVTIAGGADNGVTGCDIHAIGEAGISLAGGDRAALSPCRNSAVNNDISDVGRRRKTWAAAIHVGSPVGRFDRVSAVGCRVAHNLLHDLPHAAVLYEGNDNILEGNEVCRIALTSGDVGAFYTRQDWTSRGNLLRRNYVHDCPRANAFYIDDGDAGDTVEENVVIRSSCGPFIGGGHDNTVRNNLIIDCPVGIHFDSRGVSRGYAMHPDYRRRVESVFPDRPPWSERYPALARLIAPELDAAGVAGSPHGNLIIGNATAGCDVPLRLSGRPTELGDNTVTDNVDLGNESPLVVDMANGDLRLDPASPLLRRIPSFPQLAPGAVGLQADAYRRDTTPFRTPFDAAAPSTPLFDSATDLDATNRAAPATRPSAAAPPPSP